MGELFQDLRFGVRLMARHPAMTAVVVPSLALGIGADTTMFTIVNAVLLNPLPVRDPSRLARVVTTETRNGTVAQLGAVSRLNYVDIRDRNTVFESLATAGGAPMAVTGGAEPEQVFGQVVSGKLLRGPRSAAAAGCTFVPDEDAEIGGSPVVVLSHGLWVRRWRTCDLIGQSITPNGTPFTVIGVTGQGFRGTGTVGGPELWVPLSMAGRC
ncbi:MAG: ABC transporter permease [Vicinamibacterales bacterium]